MGRQGQAGKRPACGTGRQPPLSAADRNREIRLSALRLLLLAAALCGLALPAAAQLRQGQYELEGQNPDGSSYDGTFSLQEAPGASWLVTWQVDDMRIVGLGLIQSGVLSVSFVVDGRPGVAVYEVQPDGKLRGVWTTGGGLGTEMLTPR